MIPIDHQPPGYWATNLYATPRKRPTSDAPIKDLPPRAAQRFKRAREGIRALRHVTEQVVFMGTAWKWVWMYEVGGRALVLDGVPGFGNRGRVRRSHPSQASVAGASRVTASGACAPFIGGATFRRSEAALQHRLIHSPSVPLDDEEEW